MELAPGRAAPCAGAKAQSAQDALVRRLHHCATESLGVAIALALGRARRQLHVCDLLLGNGDPLEMD